MPITIDCFKAYDIRGQIPNQLNPDVAYRIGNATAKFLKAKKIVLGRDIRLSSKELTDAVARGITEAGVEVIDIGLGGTEMVYFATSHLKADGGIMVTASHNPADYNGLKIVREQARPVSADSGLADIRRLAESDDRATSTQEGIRAPVNIFEAYIDHIAGYVDVDALKPLKLVVNPGNGGAGIAMDGLKKKLPVRIHRCELRAGWDLPERHPESDAAREPGGDIGSGSRSQGGHGHRLGWRF